MGYPFITFAIPPPGQPGLILDLWAVVNKILGFLWLLFVGFAVIMFLISGFLFLTAKGDPNKLEVARDSLIWGVVGFIVGLLASSIPYIISNTIGA